LSTSAARSAAEGSGGGSEGDWGGNEVQRLLLEAMVARQVIDRTGVEALVWATLLWQQAADKPARVQIKQAFERALEALRAAGLVRSYPYNAADIAAGGGKLVEWEALPFGGAAAAAMVSTDRLEESKKMLEELEEVRSNGLYLGHEDWHLLWLCLPASIFEPASSSSPPRLDFPVRWRRLAELVDTSKAGDARRLSALADRLGLSRQLLAETVAAGEEAVLPYRTQRKEAVRWARLWYTVLLQMHLAEEAPERIFSTNKEPLDVDSLAKLRDEAARRAGGLERFCDRMAGDDRRDGRGGHRDGSWWMLRELFKPLRDRLKANVRQELVPLYEPRLKAMTPHLAGALFSAGYRQARSPLNSRKAGHRTETRAESVPGLPSSQVDDLLAAKPSALSGQLAQHMRGATGRGAYFRAIARTLIEEARAHLRGFAHSPTPTPHPATSISARRRARSWPCSTSSTAARRRKQTAARFSRDAVGAAAGGEAAGVVGGQGQQGRQGREPRSRQQAAAIWSERERGPAYGRCPWAEWERCFRRPGSAARGWGGRSCGRGVGPTWAGGKAAVGWRRRGSARCVTAAAWAASARAGAASHASNATEAADAAAAAATGADATRRSLCCRGRRSKFQCPRWRSGSAHLGVAAGCCGDQRRGAASGAGRWHWPRRPRHLSSAASRREPLLDVARRAGRQRRQACF